MNALFAVMTGLCGALVLGALYGLRRAQRDLELEEAERVLAQEFSADELDRQEPPPHGTKTT